MQIIYTTVATTLVLCSAALNIAFATGHLGSSRHHFVKLYEDQDSLTAYAGK